MTYPTYTSANACDYCGGYRLTNDAACTECTRLDDALQRVGVTIDDVVRIIRHVHRKEAPRYKPRR